MQASLQTALAGRYTIERELGAGGMGVVFLARDIALDRLVALKVLPPDMAQRPHTRERFLREGGIGCRTFRPLL
jgi:serine/threonine-protein kinase